MKENKKVVAVDFDGVLHSFTSGWQGTEIIADPPVEGAILWLTNLIDAGYDVVIFSCRCQTVGGQAAIKHWLAANRLHSSWLQSLKFACKKPACDILIDDRAICFRGTFPSKTEIENFKPWHGQEVW